MDFAGEIDYPDRPPGSYLIIRQCTSLLSTPSIGPSSRDIVWLVTHVIALFSCADVGASHLPSSCYSDWRDARITLGSALQTARDVVTIVALLKFYF